MQKSKEKKILGTVPKKLQFIENFWDCPEFSKGKNKGITLIALIITIIVMLILVGVTINVALNGGLFEKADTATKQTQIAADEETLQSAVISALNDELKIAKARDIQDNLPNGWEVTGTDGGPYTCTSPKGNTFTVDANGKITYTGNNANGGNGNTTGTELSEQLELLQTYFLGEIDETTGQRPGKSLEDIIEEPPFEELIQGKADPNQIKFKNIAPINNAYNNILINNVIMDEGIFIRIRYNDSIYSLTSELIGEGEDVIIKEVVPLHENIGDAGKYIQYDGKLWIVLYNEGEYGEGAQLISADTLEDDDVYLGADDSQIDWKDEQVIAEANIFSTDNPSETELLSKIEKAIYSYNHAIETLNTKCANLITDKSKIATDEDGEYIIRSVGSNPSNINAESGLLNAETGHFVEFPREDSVYSAGEFNNKVKNADENYKTDIDKMTMLGITNADNYGSYWFASRCNSEEIGYSSDIEMKEWSEGDEYEQDVLVLQYNYITYDKPCRNGVRPVITLRAGVLKQAIETDSSSNGSRTNPYIID